MRLLLIRHGQTPSNVGGTLDTAAPGPGLTTLGHRQAEAVPAALAEEEISGIYVSGLLRTHLTAAPLADALGMTPSRHGGLDEISAGDMEGRTDPGAVLAYQECAVRWGHGDLDVRLPGGEDGHRFRRRYEAALRDVQATHGTDATVAVFSHAAAIRVYAALAGDLEPATVETMRLPNSGMVVLTGDLDSGWQVATWTEHPIGGAHLTGDLDHDVTADPDAAPQVATV